MSGRRSLPSASDGVTLFDLDGVLLRGDTMASLVIARLNRVPWRYVAALPLVLGALASPSTGAWRPRFHRALVRVALHGVTADGYARLVTRTANRLRPRADRLLMETAASSAARGRTIVVTASERTLAAAFLDAVGLRDVELAASTLGLAPGPRVAMRWHNVGEAKVTALRRLAVDLTQATLYTDSASDLPLIQASWRTYLVRPSARSVRAIDRHLTAMPLHRRPVVERVI